MGISGLRKLKKTSIFRKIAMGTWQNTGDPSVYGVLEVDLFKAIPYMKELESKHQVKISPVHLVAKAISLVLIDRPEINGIIRFSRIYLRPHVDIFFQVNVPGQGNDQIKQATLSGVTIRQAENKSVSEIASELNQKGQDVRDRKKDELAESQKIMTFAPWGLSKWVLNIFSFLIYDLNLNLSFLGIPRDPFGSVMITNVGSLGIDMAWAPLVPYSKVPMLLTLGSIKDSPVVVDEKIEIRPIMKIGITFDHRFMDGIHAAAMGRHFQKCFSDPAFYLK